MFHYMRDKEIGVGHSRLSENSGFCVFERKNLDEILVSSFEY